MELKVFLTKKLGAFLRNVPRNVNIAIK